MTVHDGCATLPQLLSQHQQLITKYQQLFDCFDDLDSHLRIVEPEQPKKSDCWRRIALGYHCTLELEFNPDLAVGRPKASFFGSVSRVNDLKSKWSKYKW
jgi:E3 ubiquitin-protein ligase FANCL